MTAVEWFAKQVLEYKSPTNINGTDYILIPTNKIEFLQEQAKEMEKEQIGYSEEDVREMLFMALCEPQEECCTTHTKDSIVRKVLKTFNQLRLAEQLENEIDNL